MSGTDRYSSPANGIILGFGGIHRPHGPLNKLFLRQAQCIKRCRERQTEHALTLAPAAFATFASTQDVAPAEGTRPGVRIRHSRNPLF